jgi:hypothetical protein
LGDEIDNGFEAEFPDKIDLVNVTLVGEGTVQYIQDVYKWE